MARNSAIRPRRTAAPERLSDIQVAGTCRWTTGPPAQPTRRTIAEHSYRRPRHELEHPLRISAHSRRATGTRRLRIVPDRLASCPIANLT